MSRPRIALLNAASEGDDTRRNFRRELDADLVEYHLQSGEVPDTYDVDGAIVTGSRASVYWDLEWMGPTREWIRGAIDRGIAFLGICWGHQMLADVLGGTVEPMGEYEIGYRTVERAADSRLFDGVDDEFTVFTTHSDHVAQLPPGAELIAENDYGVHGFRKGRVFGIQSHPEYDMETAETVTKGKDLADDRIESVIDGITDENYEAACESKVVFENFVEYVSEVEAAVETASGSVGDTVTAADGDVPAAADD